MPQTERTQRLTAREEWALATRTRELPVSDRRPSPLDVADRARLEAVLAAEGMRNFARNSHLSSNSIYRARNGAPLHWRTREAVRRCLDQRTPVSAPQPGLDTLAAVSLKPDAESIRLRYAFILGGSAMLIAAIALFLAKPIPAGLFIGSALIIRAYLAPRLPPRRRSRPATSNRAFK